MNATILPGARPTTETVLDRVRGLIATSQVETSHLARYSDRRLAGIVTDHALAAADLIAEAAAAIAEQQRRGT